MHQDNAVLGFRVTCESQGPDLNRRRAALQAAASDQTLPPWRSRTYPRSPFKPSGHGRVGYEKSPTDTRPWGWCGVVTLYEWVGGEPRFPEARALQYFPVRWWA